MIASYVDYTSRKHWRTSSLGVNLVLDAGPALEFSGIRGNLACKMLCLPKQLEQASLHGAISDCRLEYLERT